MAGVVPVIPFCTVQDPGSGRIHRTVPALSQPEYWHRDEVQVAAMPGAARAWCGTAANARGRTLLSPGWVTSTTSLRGLARAAVALAGQVSVGSAGSEVGKVPRRWPTWVRHLAFAAVLILAAA